MKNAISKSIKGAFELRNWNLFETPSLMYYC